TGAGKSILLDALGLALGGRSDAALIRAGADQANVSAVFEIENPALLKLLDTVADEHGLSLETPLILRRVVGRDGKSRAFINDQPVGIALLKQIGGYLLEIHGQFDTHGLLNPATHRGLLDNFAGLDAQVKKLSDTYHEWKAAEAAWQEQQQNLERARAEQDFLSAAVNELTDLAPEAGEADKLADQRSQLQNREKITEALLSAQQALNNDRGASVALSQAGKAIARLTDKAQGLNEILAAIDRAADETAEAARMLDHFMVSLDARPDALQRIEERLFALRAMARKHGVPVDDLPALCEQLSAKIALLSDKGDTIAKLATQTKAKREAYITLAQKLGDARRKAVPKLEKAIAAELPPLKLDRARITMELPPLPEDQWSAEGMERATFLAATNPGAPFGPLHKVASGGELSRFMLALKVVLSANDVIGTLVFDEVDAGIGGSTASAVGERLARLAETKQILVVTHSPQVAARGATHMRVSKTLTKGKTLTTVDTLDQNERQEEIARMLAGAQITDAARNAAASLIADAS
ncbi:MAG: DNA repair protein RecN, partial [Alphaproteobacteria bacterium]|nr:DNA repair protein RecN [Alphaproteobacteria bacterium]